MPIFETVNVSDSLMHLLSGVIVINQEVLIDWLLYGTSAQKGYYMKLLFTRNGRLIINKYKHNIQE